MLVLRGVFCFWIGLVLMGKVENLLIEFDGMIQKKKKISGKKS